MRIRNALIVVFVSAALCACNGSQSVPAQPAATSPVDPDTLPAFVGRVWISTAPGPARGTILVFLPDKTVVRSSCSEGFRVSQWGVISASRIRWIEDSIPIEAEFRQPSSRELVFESVGTDKQDTYLAISVPYVCPKR